MKLRLRDPLQVSKARFHLEKLIKKQADIELGEITSRRTKDQNSYMHVCLGYFCNETGYMEEEAKELFSQLLPETLRYQKNGFEFRRSTSTLDSKEMTVLIDKIRKVCLEELGVYVPTPEEYFRDPTGIEIDLENQ